ncbi:hypothetical protein N5I62_03950 [Klebsiella quasipneumoniae]|uniref:hypothetical protein n=1 Tax=Klebsiella quasipneumoniae TaxID=1463165 RepID=UPI0022467A8D|nr:hypothetical protein [Klebsiella quasipneumoniae]MCW9408920.1 hypothetical protein [Klebsiella quasipneumoniae]
MKNEIEQIAQQNDMSIEFVTWFFNEKKANCGNVWFMMMAAMWEGWKGRNIEMDKMAAENVALNEKLDKLALWPGIEFYSSSWEFNNNDGNEAIEFMCDIETPATDRIVAGIKAEAKSHDLNAFISHYSAELDNHIANGGDQFDERAVRLRGVIVGARMFREKLRDEEKALALREGDGK